MLTEAASQTIEGLWSLLTSSEFRPWPVGIQQQYMQAHSQAGTEQVLT